jgi:hypothetical protein
VVAEVGSQLMSMRLSFKFECSVLLNTITTWTPDLAEALSDSYSKEHLSHRSSTSTEALSYTEEI